MEETKVYTKVKYAHCGIGTGAPKKVKLDCTQSNSYAYYKKNIPKQLQVANKKEYLLVVNLFLKKFMGKIVFNSEELRFPLNLGKLAVKKIPFNPERELLNIDTTTCISFTDWKLSKEYGKRIPFTNEHSDYARFKFYWSKYNSKAVNKLHYIFKPTRYWKRTLAKEIITNKRDYFTL